MIMMPMIPRRIIIRILLSALIVTGLYFFCEHQTRGFRFYKLLSRIPNEPRWEAPALRADEKERIAVLVKQPFSYLGKGGFCYAFLGEDQKTVLKFYTHARPACLTPYLEFAFKSSQLLFARARDKTGLIYIHLNKTRDFDLPVTLIDPIGVRHSIDLNETEFVLQHKAEFLISYIERAMKEQNQEKAKRAVDSYLSCLLALCQRGARDLDGGFRENYGILEDGTVVTMDISSFVDDPSLKRPGVYKKEIILKSHNLAKWLKKRYPDILAHYEEQLVRLVEEV
jgi:hypothetical protein